MSDYYYKNIVVDIDSVSGSHVEFTWHDTHQRASMTVPIGSNFNFMALDPKVTYAVRCRIPREGGSWDWDWAIPLDLTKVIT